MITRTEKQNDILDAALQIISERGFHDSPISAIAKQAGVGAGTIYRYYETKDDLIRDLYLREKVAVVDQMLVGTNQELTVKENFRRIWGNALRIHTSDQPKFRFMDQFYNSPYSGTVSAEERRELTARFDVLMNRAVGEKILRDLPQPVVGAVMMGTVSYLAQILRSHALELTDELSEQAFDAVWRAIAES